MFGQHPLSSEKVICSFIKRKTTNSSNQQYAKKRIANFFFFPIKLTSHLILDGLIL
jgi:hypothetical protein